MAEKDKHAVLLQAWPLPAPGGGKCVANTARVNLNSAVREPDG